MTDTTNFEDTALAFDGQNATPMPPDPVVRAYPGKADVARCKWFVTEGEQAEVHLWGLPVSAEDSRLGEGWAVRKCVVCDKVDQAYLQRQFEHMRTFDGPTDAEGPEGP